MPATPGGRLAVIGKGQFNKAVVPMDGLPRLVSGDSVIPLANSNLTAPDLTLEDTPELGGRTRQPMVFERNVDGTKLGEILLDDFGRRAARR